MYSKNRNLIRNRNLVWNRNLARNRNLVWNRNLARNRNLVKNRNSVRNRNLGKSRNLVRISDSEIEIWPRFVIWSKLGFSKSETLLKTIKTLLIWYGPKSRFGKKQIIFKNIQNLVQNRHFTNDRIFRNKYIIPR